MSDISSLSTGTSAIPDSALPAAIQKGSESDKNTYKTALGFENQLVQQLTTQMASTVSQSDALFISHQGTPPAYPTVITVFLQVVRSIGVRESPGSRGPRIHDLRHTFAVRSLERCAHDAHAVSRHITALSTYLGHAHVSDTYWYLQATPELMAHLAVAGEALHRGEPA